MIRILHFISGIKSGGVEQMLTNYTKYINKDNNIKEYIVYQHAPNKISLDKLQRAGNNCIRIYDKRVHPFKNLYDTYYLIRKYKPDIIHAHMSLLNFIPLFFGLICGIKIRISHSHSAYKTINSNILEFLFKIFNIIFANVLVACGQKAGKYMYGNHNFKIIPNSININQFYFNNNTRQKIRKSLGIKSNEILIGNVGRLTNQKNQVFLLKILSNILINNGRYKLIIIGNGENKERILDIVNKYGLNNNFILHDPVKNISDYYNAMDIFLLPSLYEGFPVSSIEAQASGLKTIMSYNIDNTSKLLEGTEFISTDNSSKWINSILKYNFYYTRYIDKNNFSKYNILDNYKLLFNLYKGAIYAKKISRK